MFSFRQKNVELPLGAIWLMNTISDIERACSSVSRPMIRVVMERLRDQGVIEVIGVGRSAKWRKRDNNHTINVIINVLIRNKCYW